MIFEIKAKELDVSPEEVRQKDDEDVNSKNIEIMNVCAKQH
jgi:hypothetical protein